MDVRRVQRFGKSTLMVSLPADWVKEVALNPGESVYIEVDEDGGLKIYPPSSKVSQTTHELRVLIRNKTPPDLFGRIIYSSYILGFDKVTFEQGDGAFMDEEALKNIKEATRSLIGLEIISRSPDKVVIQCFLDPSKYSMGGLIARLSSVLKQMIHYLALGIKEGSRTFLEEVLELEKDADRLYYLSLRQLILSQTNRSLGNLLGVKKIQIVGNRILVKSLEEAADEVSEAALDLLSIPPSDLESIKIIWDKLDVYIEQATVVIDHAVKALNKEDIKLSNEVMEELKTLRRVLLTQLNEIERNLGNAGNLSVIGRLIMMRMYNALRRMEPIVEISFNRSIESIKGDTLIL
jgi:phosphate uptake regulator